MKDDPGIDQVFTWFYSREQAIAVGDYHPQLVLLGVFVGDSDLQPLFLVKGGETSVDNLTGAVDFKHGWNEVELVS